MAPVLSIYKMVINRLKFIGSTVDLYKYTRQAFAVGNVIDPPAEAIAVPNGSTITSGSLAGRNVMQVFVGGVFVQPTGTGGYVYDPGTGTIDFSGIGGVYDTLVYAFFQQEESVSNEQLVHDFFVEIAYELEPCFRVRFLPDGTEDWDRVGVEANYNIAQKTIIADLIAVYLLMMQSAVNMEGDGSGSTAPAGTFLKRAKAGSAEVEWEQFSLKNGMAKMVVDTGNLMDRYKSSAARRLRNLGCILDICDDCVGQAELLDSPKPFLIVSNCGCGC